jgi:hypothetical protein
VPPAIAPLSASHKFGVRVKPWPGNLMWLAVPLGAVTTHGELCVCPEPTAAVGHRGALYAPLAT